MNRKIFIEFIKDQISFTLAIFGSSSLVIVFYWLQLGQAIEVIYPLLLVTFVYVIFMIFRASSYLSFNKILQTLNGKLDDHLFQGKRLTDEQKKVVDTIKKLENKSLQKFNQLELENENKYKVISQIIHNIKTPTSVIDLIVQNSKEEKTNTDEVIEKINKENRLINDNLNQVLSYLRLDYFQNDFLIEETDLTQQLRELINLKKASFIYNQVFPQLIVEDETITVLTDKKWNRLLVDQIISNAIKYTAIQKSKKSVYFRIERDGDRVHLIIEDTGIGIAESDLKRVFEPFFTGENGRKIRNATGIGLHISKNIADRLNHQIKLSSIEGKGTKVIVSYLTKM